MTFKEYVEITGQVSSAYHEAALKFQLTDCELDVLYVLCAHEPGCYQSALYRETGRTRSTVNSAVKKMEKKELLYITQGPGRNTCVFMTEKGKLLMKDTVYKIIHIENEIYDSWTEEERRTFMRLSRDYAKKLEKKVKEL